MKVDLFPFQKIALAKLRMQTAEALGSYRRTHTPQVVSFTAPTGAGKTIIMASLFESIYFGDENFPDQQDAIFIWLSDSPQLNEQSKDKIDLKADKIKFGRCITVADESFDKEMFDDGYVYFLNTQKLGVNSNLTKHSDSRQYTIWETLANTAREKSDRLYFVIDEAHRGMQGNEAGRATSIMQKFLKGSPEDKIDAMPVVIGMSATTERFNHLVEGTTSTIHRVVVTADDVRKSGLLKDRIIITYPEENSINKDMAVLQAATDDWIEKCKHWNQYCTEQHYAQVNPVFVIQVLNGTGEKLSDTDLDDCLRKIEERIETKFEKWEVVHTFGQTTSSITINGLEVPYTEPSRIADDKKIKVVFFKENLSTGWDCPRAETMMSFRHAKDSTYIAQLLGRMVRTPMQKHILVDDILNDVHLYLPYFDENTVSEVVESLQNSEGGNIPTEVLGETLNNKKFETLTVKTSNVRNSNMQEQNTPTLDGLFDSDDAKQSTSISSITQTTTTSVLQENITTKTDVQNTENQKEENNKIKEEVVEGTFDREEVMKFINDSGLLTYDVRSVRINDYLISLYKLMHLLTSSGLCKIASSEVRNEIVQMIRIHIEDLKEKGEYEELTELVCQFKLSTQIFDVFGESVDNHSVQRSFFTTDSDIERQFRLAELKLGNEGIGTEYGKKYFDPDDPFVYEIDVIIFAADTNCIEKLKSYAENKFHQLNDEYRRRIAKINSEEIRRKYDNIVSDGDIISKHNFHLPETIQIACEEGGKTYKNHLFVNEDTGVAKLNLNNWEEGVIAEEEKQENFVCWLRNPPRKNWALCIPYEINGETKPAYPDFIVIRKDELLGYVIDILEPHNPTFADNLGKAKGFAEYARQNPGVGRIQLVRMGKDAAGKNHFKRLDMSMSYVRDKISRAMTNDEIDHIFDTDGFFI